MEDPMDDGKAVDFYVTSPTNPRRRRGKQDMATIRKAMYEALDQDNPMTVRQVFYRMVSDGVIGKTEAEYKGTVCRLLANMRREGEIPFGWIADNTRWMRKPRTYSSMEDALNSTARAYRRALWDNQDCYVEMWLEKDALAGVLVEETKPWDVPLMVTRGYPSISYLYEAAEAIEDYDRPTYLYYFGDYDPSGMDITRFVEKEIREYAPEAEIYFERVAVTPSQIEEMRLPTRPTKQSDSRSKAFVGESVEVDAIKPRVLRQMVEQCITRHVDPHALEITRRFEAQEKLQLQEFARGWLSRNEETR